VILICLKEAFANVLDVQHLDVGSTGDLAGADAESQAAT
jgi:hypothetical protein